MPASTYLPLHGKVLDDYSEQEKVLPLSFTLVLSIFWAREEVIIDNNDGNQWASRSSQGDLRGLFKGVLALDSFIFVFCRSKDKIKSDAGRPTTTAQLATRRDRILAAAVPGSTCLCLRGNVLEDHRDREKVHSCRTHWRLASFGLVSISSSITMRAGTGRALSLGSKH